MRGFDEVRQGLRPRALKTLFAAVLALCALAPWLRQVSAAAAPSAAASVATEIGRASCRERV